MSVKMCHSCNMSVEEGAWLPSMWRCLPVFLDDTFLLEGNPLCPTCYAIIERAAITGVSAALQDRKRVGIKRAAAADSLRAADQSSEG